MLKANIGQSKKTDEESSSGWTSARKAIKAKAFVNGGNTNMPGAQSKSASNTGAKAFTKQKSKSFEEKMDHGGSGPVSEVTLQIQSY